jgi:5-methylthioadenosine/S-adenosylhomocysteine deaminase
VTITQIRAADWVIAWDQGAGGQVYRRDIDVVFEGDTLTHIGPGFAGQADQVVDGRGLMVMPGLVDIHSHPGHEPAYRGIREEHGRPGMYMTGCTSAARRSTPPTASCAWPRSRWPCASF